MNVNTTFEKVKINSFDSIPVEQDSPIIYVLRPYNKLNLSILARIQPNPIYLVVLFNAATTCNRSTEPTFMRWSWAEKADLSYIIIDDPIVSSSESTNIAWYIGLNEFDLQGYICNLINNILIKTNLNPCNVIFSGSSGGGFASLMASIRLKGSNAVVNNPQTDVLKYSRRLRAQFIDIFGEDETIIKKCYYHRFSVNKAMDYYNYAPNVLYRQNIKDKSHLNQHFNPFHKHYHNFVKQQDLAKPCLNVIMYDDPRGHSSVATYEDFICDINKAND
jgi:hypothetical protein